MMEPSSPKSSEDPKVTEFIHKVHKLADEAGIEVTVFANDGEASSMYSNAKNIEDAGNTIAASILYTLQNVTDAPRTASTFVDVFIAALAYATDMVKDIKKSIKEQLENGH